MSCDCSDDLYGKRRRHRHCVCPPGPAGPIGPIGPTGPSGVSVFDQFVTSTADNSAIIPVTFGTDWGTLLQVVSMFSSPAFTVAGGVVTVNVSGIYKITFRVLFTIVGVPRQVTILFSIGPPSPGGIYTPSISTEGPLTGNEELVSNSIVTLSAGNELRFWASIDASTTANLHNTTPLPGPLPINNNAVVVTITKLA